MGRTHKFTDTLMAALGDATMLSTEDTCAILDLYMGDGNIHKVPPSMAEARGDKAAGSQAMSVAQACSKKGSLSSLEDETSQDMTPLGEGIGTTPLNEAL